MSKTTAPAVTQREPGKWAIGNTYRLADGQVRGQAVILDAQNLGWLADLLDAWIDQRIPAEDQHTRGKDTIDLHYGGTDWEPVITIINFGANGGSLSLAFDAGKPLVAALRARAAKVGDVDGGADAG